MEAFKLYKFDVKRVKDECVKWIKDWFEENGKDCKAVVGISGGKDSSVVAALCCEALGKDRVFGVLMPQGNQPDIDVSYDVVEYLGIDAITVDICPTIRCLKHEIKRELGNHWSRQTSINLPARIRMATLYAISQTINGRVANTCNYSEDYVGYATRWGDSVGDFSPISNFTVEEVKCLGKELGLPDRFINKTPTDGLCGQTDEENLGFTYQELDNYIRKGIEPTAEIKQKIDELHQKNEFKMLPMPRFNPIIF